MTVERDDTMVEEPRKLRALGVRHVQVTLLFFLLAVGIGMRVQLSVAIVAMTDNSTSSNPDIPTYDWDNKSIILSSFYWGYLTLQVFAGALGKMYGTKRFLIGAMTFNSSASILVPFAAAKFGSYGVMGCRILQGIGQGFFYPSVYNMLGRWAPVSERANLSNLALSGYAFGAIVTTPLVGYISSTSIGWPATFYIYAGMGFVWLGMWIIFGASSPAESKSISKEEREYIESSLDVKADENLVVPWKSILTSVPVWALAVASAGLNWGNITLGTEIPTYMNSVMKFDIKSNGLLASAPSLAQFITSFMFAPYADYLINNGKLSRAATRKIFTGIAGTGMALALIALGFLPEDANTLSIIMFIATYLFLSASSGGTSVNHLDLSPKYAGIINAITNSTSNGIAMLAPLMVQAVVTDETDKMQWRIVFLTAAGMCTLANLAFVFFSSSKIQSWAD